MADTLNIEEIEARYASEWILLENPETDDALAVRRGTVLCHSKDRDEVYREAVKRHLRRFAMLYTGKPAADTAIVL